MPEFDMRHASAYAAQAEALADLLPADPMNVASFAAGHRWLANEGGGYVGLWNHAQAPYLVEPMECLTSTLHDTTCLVGPGQCGKTAVAENWLLAMVPNDPADMLWYMQTDSGLQAYIKQTIDPMIAQHRDELQRNLGLRAVDDSLHFKKFRTGMTVQFLSAVHANLINKKAGRIVADEIDAYARSLGDVKALLDVRRQTYFGSMLLAMSHPDLATGLSPDRDWEAGIMAIYRDSDRRLFWWPCPHCDGWSSPNPTASRVMNLGYDESGDLDLVEQSVHLECPINGCVVADKDRPAMLESGKWVGLGEEIAPDGTVTGTRIRHRTAGFWITGTMSLLIRGGLGELARAKVKAERDFASSSETDAETTLRTVMVKRLGVPYVAPRKLQRVAVETLVDRAEGDLKLGLVPAGVRFLTLWVDAQIAHFDWLLRGWGVDGESWIVDKGRLAGDPATSAPDWDNLLTQVLLKRWPLADLSGRAMGVEAAGFDSGGAPGVTRQSNKAWKRWLVDPRRPVRLHGKSEGRDVYSIVPTKGAGGANAPRLALVYPSSARKDRNAGADGTVPLLRFSANLFKDDLAGQLGVANPGAEYVHFPSGLKSDEAPHIWFEQLLAEERDLAGRWTKIRGNAKNEPLDQMVGCHALAQARGLDRIDWKRPPAWAAPWDHNRKIGPGAARTPQPAPPSAAAPAASAPQRRSLASLLPH